MSAPARPESLAKLEKLLAALAARGIVSAADLDEAQARTDRASPEIGARMVARAWLDPDWRALLLRDGAQAAEQMGVSMAGAPPLGVLEDKSGLHHLVVCTLCSCYPRAVLGYPPSWYKSFEYRSRAVREPRAVLAEWGTVLPPGTKIRVVDSTADYRWMVLPERPAGTEGWSEDRLAALVTRDALVGVALPQAPVAAAAE
ncbi:nitrile hydratase subunit alpha [Paracraurococcus ruber]|uniref:Nitrile hydratase n=1 Tax=Paracraurococcus ruber TaxID=77675 RepID=A0ABS1D7E7_9PROT|nr:nitrile hydratase subunit alpha [Paracraurococcus ruber]MBK1662182.1 nitrile hydratase [Paracraurococcus ruber]TDG19939.1 nitrile hydratase [Paracraurococcus ruber]